jgi:hypothetical protein
VSGCQGREPLCGGPGGPGGERITGAGRRAGGGGGNSSDKLPPRRAAAAVVALPCTRGLHQCLPGQQRAKVSSSCCFGCRSVAVPCQQYRASSTVPAVPCQQYRASSTVPAVTVLQIRGELQPQASTENLKGWALLEGWRLHVACWRGGTEVGGGGGGGGGGGSAPLITACSVVCGQPVAVRLPAAAAAAVAHGSVTC